jgi:hypothetical protein
MTISSCAMILSAAFTLSCGAHSSFVGSPPATVISQFSAGSAPGSVCIADINGDGKPDILVANEQSNNLTVLLGDGKGNFTESKGSPFPAGHAPNDIAIGDFNRDGRLDIAFANHEEKHLMVLLGDGQGGFVPAPNSPFSVGVIPHTHGVATADFNGDGNLDLVTDSWGNDQIEIVFGDGKGSFTTPGLFFPVGKHPYQRVRAADLNGDGNADIITTNLDGDNVTILLGDGRGGFKPSTGSPFRCGDSPFNVAVGDVNGDGRQDLAIVNSPGSTTDGRGTDGLTILLGNGKGEFMKMTGSPFAAGIRPNLVAVGDVNGDGVADIAVSSPDGNTITLFLMSKEGVSASSTIPIGGKPKGLAICDLNGDGRGDLVITNNGVDSVTVVLIQ